MQRPLQYTAFDLATGLDVAAKIYDMSTGTAVLVTTETLDHVINGTYVTNYVFNDSKPYLVNIMVYTDGTYATPDENYAPIGYTIDKQISLDFRKNQAKSNFAFPMYDTDGELVTGRTVTAERRIDNGVFEACDNAPTEVSDGFYSIDFSDNDLDGDTIAFKFTASGARPTVFTVVTQE